MQISPTLGLAVMANNFFHDLASGLFIASGVALWAMLRKYDGLPAEQRQNRAVREYFVGLYRSMTRLARFSLYLILLGGVPRTLFYRDFEWDNAVGHGQVPALIAMHVLTFSLVALGVWLWIKLGRRVRGIEESLGLRRT